MNKVSCTSDLVQILLPPQYRRVKLRFSDLVGRVVLLGNMATNEDPTFLRNLMSGIYLMNGIYMVSVRINRGSASRESDEKVAVFFLKKSHCFCFKLYIKINIING